MDGDWTDGVLVCVLVCVFFVFSVSIHPEQQNLDDVQPLEKTSCVNRNGRQGGNVIVVAVRGRVGNVLKTNVDSAFSTVIQCVAARAGMLLLLFDGERAMS